MLQSEYEYCSLSLSMNVALQSDTRFHIRCQTEMATFEAIASEAHFEVPSERISYQIVANSEK